MFEISLHFKALAAVNRARMACGGATATRPVSSTVPTVTPARERPERACVGQATGG